MKGSNMSKIKITPKKLRKFCKDKTPEQLYDYKNATFGCIDDKWLHILNNEPDKASGCDLCDISRGCGDCVMRYYNQGCGDGSAYTNIARGNTYEHKKATLDKADIKHRQRVADMYIVLVMLHEELCAIIEDRIDSGKGGS